MLSSSGERYQAVKDGFVMVERVMRRPLLKILAGGSKKCVARHVICIPL